MLFEYFVYHGQKLNGKKAKKTTKSSFFAQQKYMRASTTLHFLSATKEMFNKAPCWSFKKGYPLSLAVSWQKGYKKMPKTSGRKLGYFRMSILYVRLFRSYSPPGNQLEKPKKKRNTENNLLGQTKRRTQRGGVWRGDEGKTLYMS